MTTTIRTGGATLLSGRRRRKKKVKNTYVTLPEMQEVDDADPQGIMVILGKLPAPEGAGNYQDEGDFILHISRLYRHECEKVWHKVDRNDDERVSVDELRRYVESEKEKEVEAITRAETTDDWRIAVDREDPLKRFCATVVHKALSALDFNLSTHVGTADLFVQLQDMLSNDSAFLKARKKAFDSGEELAIKIDKKRILSHHRSDPLHFEEL